MSTRWILCLACSFGFLTFQTASGNDPQGLAGWLRPVNDEQYGGAKTLFMWNSPEEPSGGPPDWDEPLASDRPDVTEASSTVGRGVSQLEMGYTYFYDDGNGARLESHSYPEMLLRQGFLADWLELRVGWNFAGESERIATAPFSITSSGVEDLYLGIKLGLTQQQGILPEMALVPQMTVPLGSSFSADRVLPGANWLYGWEVSDFISTAGGTQFNLAVDGSTADEYVEYIQTWTIGYSLAEKIGAYTEWFVLVPAGAESARTEHYFDGGFTYNWSNNLQFDVRVGKGVSSAATDFFTGVGAVVRF
jgi:hypothetical protein